MALDVKSLVGEEMKAVLPDLARLRIIVFRDWPYLYDGTLEYEQKYLAKLAAAKGAVCVVARDGTEIVGASTAAPMIEHADEFAEPFERAGYDLDRHLLLRRIRAAEDRTAGTASGTRSSIIARRTPRSSAASRTRRFCRVDAPRRPPAEAEGLPPARRLLEEARLYAPSTASSPTTAGRTSTRRRRRTTPCSSG